MWECSGFSTGLPGHSCHSSARLSGGSSPAPRQSSLGSDRRPGTQRGPGLCGQANTCVMHTCIDARPTPPMVRVPRDTVLQNPGEERAYFSLPGIC